MYSLSAFHGVSLPQSFRRAFPDVQNRVSHGFHCFLPSGKILLNYSKVFLNPVG